MPKSSRPPERRSMVAACSASSTGLCHGSTKTAVPRRSVLVFAATQVNSARLDEKGGMITERLGLDIVFDELTITLARIRVGAAMAGRGAAEQTEAHEGLSYFAAFLLCRANVAHGRRRELEHDPEKWLPVFGKDHAQTKM